MTATKPKCPACDGWGCRVEFEVFFYMNERCEKCKGTGVATGDAAPEQSAGSLHPVVGRTPLTLTAQEIRHLAQFCGMVLQEPTASEAEDERETEIIIAPWPEKGVQGDDGPLPPHSHIAYYREYPEEGCVPLGSPNDQAQRLRCKETQHD